jgi:hypothetical protein
MPQTQTRGLPFFWLLLLLAAAVAFPSTVLAQGDDPDEPEEEEDDEEEDDDGRPPDDDDDDGNEVDIDSERRESPRARRQEAARQQQRRRQPREVVKGFYAKVNLGPLIWMPPISSWTSSTGTAFDVSLGGDVIDQLGFTLSIEGSFFQLVTNGDGVSSDLGLQLQSPIQGDFRVFGGIVGVRAGPNLGGKRVKRISVAGHAGGGIGYSPPLVDMQDARVLQRMVYGSIMQGRALGLVQAGVGVEYYTRLSHFSLGLDVDFDLIIGGPVVAMGLALDFFVKYTF